MKKTVLIALLGLAACSTPVEMRHPASGETRSCGPFSTHGGGISAAAREARCIQDYKEQGFVRR